MIASLAASSPRFLLMSCNDPNMNIGLSEWENTIKPILIQADTASYRAHIPLVQIKPKGVLDYQAIHNDHKLSQCIVMSFQ